MNTGYINVKQGDAAIILSGDRLGSRIRGKLTGPPQIPKGMPYGIRRVSFVFESGLLLGEAVVFLLYARLMG